MTLQLRRFAAGWSSGKKHLAQKTPMLSWHWYADDVVAYDVVPPLQYVGKEAYRADYQQFFSQYDSDLKVEVRDLRIGASGDLGYATALQLVSGTLKGGKKYEVWVRFTSLFRKSDGHWLDFHDHVSVPADVATGKAMLELKP
jgi:ketosteroid isomerase-like protein